MGSTQADNQVISEIRKESDWYEISWDNGYVGQYPYVWLRDNCPCSACYYPSSRQRSSLLAHLDIDMTPRNEELDHGGREVKVYWPDDHMSPFPSHWLYLHRFDRSQFDPIKQLVPKSWGSEMADTIPTFEYHKAMEDQKTLQDWLTSLVVSGLAVLTGAPKETGVLETIGKRVGHLRTTIYGPTFQVVALASSSNLAYTNKALGLHVDLPLYECPPSVQMLHCIKQCETHGGESQFADAMKITADLKQSDPEVFNTLTKVKVDFRLRGTDFVPYHFQFAKPVITLDADGQFKCLSYNNGVRAPYLNCPVEEVKTFYKSLACFDQKLYDKENLISFKLREGDIVTFNNNRVMHGRNSFTLAHAEEAGTKSRHLEGAYLDWDIIYSCLRLLAEELHCFPVL